MSIDRPTPRPERVYSEGELSLSRDAELVASVCGPQLVYPSLDTFSHRTPFQKAADTSRANTRGQNMDTEEAEGHVMANFLRTTIEREDWFDAHVVPTTKFDTVANHVDLVLEWDRGPDRSPIQLGIDLSSAANPNALLRKLHALSAGSMVTYFESKVSKTADGAPVQESLSGLPTVMLGFDASYLSKIAQTVRDKKQAKTVTDAFGRPQHIADMPAGAFQDHPLAFVLLEQARAQLALQVREKALPVLQIVKQYAEYDDAVRAQLASYLKTKSPTMESVLVVMRAVWPTITKLQASGRISDTAWSEWAQRLMVHNQVEEVLAARQTKSGESRRRANALGKNSPLHARLCPAA